MNRTLTYFITKADTPLTVKGFLKRQGFSSRNLIDLKKLPDSIRLNGQNAYMNAKISPGDELTVSICEEESSENESEGLEEAPTGSVQQRPTQTHKTEQQQQLQVATATSVYIAPNGKKYETIGVVKIPKINIKYPILSKPDA